ncbi:ATP-binding protein [Streptomyces qinzhouensis]|uniref:ATP-binding protein n=1 Tax=Streptomyces qinzhouensis TaxID=2599401 RepID=A0A5B8JC15_9ACTN|nr:ATP-binding protein [Streptomyces qinzhouensis]QDY78014.1 ATP-binding protein [Streptomyces qinzhouensis]
MTLYPTPESVPRARRWFRRFIERHDPVCCVDDCLVMLSELVTNAVAYGESEDEWRVRVDWWRIGDALCVNVHNPGTPAHVHMRLPSDEDTHGRGLQLVDVLADDWSVGPSPYGGTVVTFVLHKAWAE